MPTYSQPAKLNTGTLPRDATSDSSSDFIFSLRVFHFFSYLRVIYRVYERLLCCSSYSGLVAYSESVSFMARARTNKLWREGLNNVRRSSAINEEHLMLRDYMSDRTLNYVIDATDNRLLY